MHPEDIELKTVEKTVWTQPEFSMLDDFSGELDRSNKEMAERVKSGVRKNAGFDKLFDSKMKSSTLKLTSLYNTDTEDKIGFGKKMKSLDKKPGKFLWGTK